MKETIRNVTRRKLRSFLTISGIVIGTSNPAVNGGTTDVTARAPSATLCALRGPGCRCDRRKT